MAEVVYLHVGAPKTGTTYLQDRLYLNRSSLASHGIRYPVGLHADMFAPALDLIERDWGGQRESVRGEWSSLVGRVRRAPGTVVISHEILAGAERHQVDRALADLAPADLHLVVSARDLARQLPAEWQETVKHQSGRRFRTFLRRARTTERSDSPMWFWRAQHLPDVLSRWGGQLPPDRVHLVTVPPAGAPREELWRRYCRALSLDPAWAPQDSDRANVSIGIDEIALLRVLNGQLNRAGLTSADYRSIVRERLVHQTLAGRRGMRRVTLPPEAYDWVEPIAAEWVEHVQRTGIEVIGDVQDLCPARPEPEAKWRNPDKPRPGRTADATMDALVAAVLEAARRPDPEQSPAGRLTRVARRLRGR